MFGSDFRLEDVFGRLDPEHAEALSWFADHEGEVLPRPQYTRNGVRLVDPQSGIWKPRGLPYAVSIVQTMRGGYPDEEPINWPDGLREIWLAPDRAGVPRRARSG